MRVQLLGLSWGVLVAACSSGQPVDELVAEVGSELTIASSVLTQHNDNNRTGSFSKETILTPANVLTGGFHKRGTLAVDGQVYAQPLYASGVTVGGIARNVVYVATMHNSVYAFDADSLSPLWQTPLGGAFPIYAPLGCNPGVGIPEDPACAMIYTDYGHCCGPLHDIMAEVGILSTPVIDPNTQTLYAVRLAMSSVQAQGDPRAYQTTGTQHIVFRGTDNHIHERWAYEEKWERIGQSDLSVAAGATATLAASNPYGYSTSNGSAQHVAYRGTDNNIYLLSAGSTWTVANITALTGAPKAQGDPFAYTDGGTEHIVFRSSSNAIIELFGAGLSWSFNNISGLAGAPAAASAPFGYLTPNDALQHVVYRGSDNGIYQLSAGSAWTSRNLTSLARAPAASGNPTAYLSSGSVEHVVYRGTDNKIHELFGASSWAHSTISALAGGPLSSGDPFGYTTENGVIQHVIYPGADKSVNELTAGSAWVLYNPNRAFSDGAPFQVGQQSVSNVFGYSTTGTNQHLVYRDTFGFVQELHAGYMWRGAVPNLGLSHELVAIDIRTGSVLRRVAIQGSVSGTGEGATGNSINFDSKRQLQRPALLLANNRVYIAFGAVADMSPYHGWIFAYDAADFSQKGVFNSTPNAGKGGIWMGGQGLAADASGFVYATTGNSSKSWDKYDFPGPGAPGTNAQPAATASGSNYLPGDLGEAFLKLDSSLNLKDYFVPGNTGDLGTWCATSNGGDGSRTNASSDMNFATMNNQDFDLSSAGASLIPDTNLLYGGGKPGWIYLLNTGNMGKYRTPDLVNQLFHATCPNPSNWARHIHGTPVFFQGTDSLGSRMYVWGESDQVRAFRWNGTSFVTPPALTSALPTQDDIGYGNMPGGVLSLSSNNGANGVVWATHVTAQGGTAQGSFDLGTLRAFNASTLALLYSSDTLAADKLGTFGKFAPPTVANGKVYVSTFSKNVAVYGL